MGLSNLFSRGVDSGANWTRVGREVQNVVVDAGALISVSTIGPLDASICFMHIPKCAGTSVDSAIRRHYRSLWEKDGSRAHKWLDPRAADRVSESTDESMWRMRRRIISYYLAQKETRFASGHFQISTELLDRFGSDYSFVTLLRDPVKRWISHYWFNRAKDSDQAFSIDTELNEFLETERARGIGQIFLSYFSGTGELSPEERATEQVMDQAIANMRRFDLIGFVEHMSDFTDKFQENFGAGLRVMRRNVSPVATEKRDVDPATRERIRDVCREDIQLHEQAIAQFGPG